MRRRPIRLIHWTLVAAVASILILLGWFSGHFSAYREGSILSEYDLHPSRPTRTVFFRWATTAYEPVAEYSTKNQRNLGSFSGSILLCRPGSPMDGYTLGVMGGKFSHGEAYGLEDPEVKEDVRVLREKNLRAMIAQTKGDWRIVNDDGHFVQVDHPKFSGHVQLSRPGWFRTMMILEVVEDRIVRVSRMPILFD
jgi:hypothetical protein